MQEKLLERIFLPADIVLAIIFSILIVLNITSSSPQKTTEPVTKTEDETKVNETAEDNSESDTSVATKQFNATIRNDLYTFLNTINQYQANNRGAIPETADNWITFNKNYLETDFTKKYQFIHCDHEQGNCVLPSALTWANNAYIIYTASHASCNDKDIIYTTGKRKLAIYTHLKGETNGVYCLSN